MSSIKTVADPGNDYAWVVETSDDGDAWWPEPHPVHGQRDSGGIDTANANTRKIHAMITRGGAQGRRPGTG